MHGKPTAILLYLGLLLAACSGSDNTLPGATDASAIDASIMGRDAGSDGAFAWEPLPDVGGGPIQETGVAELDGKIYVIGGFTEDRAIVPDVQVYDIAGRTWSTAAPLPSRIHHANVAATGGKLYVLGALIGGSFQQLGDSWQYDPAANAWTELMPMGDAEARGSAAVGVIDGKIYVVGGYRNGSAVSAVSAYDPIANAWQHDLAPLPAPRDHLAGAAVGGIFYAISGRNGSIASITDRVDAYDPAANAWTARAPIPTGRGGMAAGVVSGKIIVVGGEGASVPSGVFSEVEMYDPEQDTWSTLPPMRTPRHGMGAAGYEGALYVPGGADIRGLAAIATHDVLTPE